MRRYDSLPPVPPRFASFTWAVPCCALDSLHPAEGAPWDGLECWSPGLLLRDVCTEMTGPPRFLGEPQWCACPALRPRRTLGARPVRPRGYSLPLSLRRRLLDAVLSRLDHTACTLAVYASQAGLPQHHARLASGWWPPLAGQDWRPAGFTTKSFKEGNALLFFSSLPRLRLAQKDLTPLPFTCDPFT